MMQIKPISFHPEEIVRQLPPNVIFVFGSNLAGRHGKGAALTAKMHFGAVYGLGAGLMGQSYAIPTKDESLQTLSLDNIKAYIQVFKFFVESHPELFFYLTPIGCGLAGYQPQDIAPLFTPLINLNIIFPVSFKPYLLPRS